MTATTPFLAGEDRLHPLTSCYVRTDALSWKPTPTPGIGMKILLQDAESGLLTALFRWAPGTELALHEHVEIEQSFLLKGSLDDEEGEVLPATWSGAHVAIGMSRGPAPGRRCCASSPSRTSSWTASWRGRS